MDEQPRQGTASRRRDRIGPKLLTGLVCLLAGALMTASAVVSRGDDLRPTRTDDLAVLVDDQARSNQRQAAAVASLRAEVQQLGEAQDSLAPAPGGTPDPLIGLQAVSGPAVRVTLTDAPLDVQPAGVDEDLLVVHQQDIQHVANALWAGGAEAMTIQGRRVIATTGIKCVGNTVVLDGVPYAPPYVITAIGGQAALEASLDSDPYLKIYREYTRAYQLGYQQQRLANVAMPAYEGAVAMTHATPRR